MDDNYCRHRHCAETETTLQRMAEGVDAAKRSRQLQRLPVFRSGGKACGLCRPAHQNVSHQYFLVYLQCLCFEFTELHDQAKFDPVGAELQKHQQEEQKGDVHSVRGAPMRGDAEAANHENDICEQVEALDDVARDDGEEALRVVAFEHRGLYLAEVVGDDDQEHRAGGGVDGDVQKQHPEKMHQRMHEATSQGPQVFRKKVCPTFSGRSHDQVEEVDSDRSTPAFEHLEHVEDDIQLQEGLPTNVVIGP
mmetsp:Transcript_93315/g.194731  ORF Transcript_93315/g.194731 Transcript_93315/m.194731 type:complete len:250 (+) Transcript_93315:503-1252(+)